MVEQVQPQSILIVGAGIAGTTLATFLLSCSLPISQLPCITILERAPSIRPHGQNIDIRGAGLTIIRKLGLETAIRASLTNEAGVRLVDSRDGVWSESAAGKGDEEGSKSPTAELEILRGRLAEVCCSRCRDVSAGVERNGGRGVEFVFGDYLDAIVQAGDHIKVRFKKSGHRRSFDIVVGADGLQSGTRKLVWGHDGDVNRVKKLGMYAGFFSMPAIESDDLWRRWYHAPGRRSIMLRPDGGHGKTTVLMSVVNETDQRLPAAAGRHDVDGQKNLLAEYFQDAGWKCDRVIKGLMASDDFYYDLVGQVKMSSWSKGRVVLLGDAGYCASPISGMGTTLALTGAYHLAGALTQHRHNYTAAFSQYTEKMRPVVERAQKLPPGQPHLSHPETAWGICVFRAIIYFFYVSGVFKLLFKVLGPKARSVPIVEDYGFRQLNEFVEEGCYEPISSQV